MLKTKLLDQKRAFASNSMDKSCVANIPRL
jgi:hypothetical protein